MAQHKTQPQHASGGRKRVIFEYRKLQMPKKINPLPRIKDGRLAVAAVAERNE